MTEQAWHEPVNYFIEFYLSLIAYFVLHMIFVISSDFVEAFNIPPLNIGIYVDKLAAIRALLMVIADVIEYGFLDQLGDKSGKMQKSLVYAVNPGSKQGDDKDVREPNNPRRIGSIVSFIGMLVCRSVYLYLIYNSDNKSLSVFITLCIEGFWFGVFQMSFFAIGPQYNAVTSLGIHTMGNFIFFLQLILQHYAKTKPKINSLYRVRVHGWIVVVTSVLALAAWLYFCCCVYGKNEDLETYLSGKSVSNANQFKNEAVWSPFLLFIIGAFAEDFSVPGVLPFALLDPEKANLVNYLTPLFFMTGAILTVLANDVFTNESLGFKLSWGDCKFKLWSTHASQTDNEGKWWHFLWLLNIPKYIAFFIAMWSIHGTFEDLRCIIQSRWRVLVLTMFVVIPRATLETAGYVGVANYALSQAGLGDGKSDYDGFGYIAYHDMLAMFCRFVYGKFAVGYNTSLVSVEYT